MTNQEVGKVIKDGLEDMSLDFADEEQYEALTMAIKALEQEPSGDVISRQAVLDYIDQMPSELTTDGRRMIRRRRLEEYIFDTLPSVQPKTDVLAKIRAEIDNALSDGMIHKKTVLGIIDKYKAESEDKE